MEKLWGGRFQKDLTKAVELYTESISTDQKMVLEDIWGSEAHAIMLAAQKIIAEEDLRHILKWLEKAKQDFLNGTFQLQLELEDVHMNVETYLHRGAGPEFGGKLHTARSRNDQVITDTKLHVRFEILRTQRLISDLQYTLLRLAEEHAETLAPGFTHVQHAQPITLGFWATAYASMLTRDHERFNGAYDRTNTSPLGACALAGSSFPIDRRLTARLLGFASVHENALDVVSSRDFASESLACLAILMSNLSKLAEEMVYWSSHEFRTIELDDSYTLGSSIMPQKKNPCVAELLRSRTGRAYGALMQMLTIMKGIPSGYNRDLQEDRVPLWESFGTAQSSLAIFSGMVGSLKVKTDRMNELAGAEFATATELANYLAHERGIAFRQSHKIVGGLVGLLVEQEKTFSDYETVRAYLSEQGICIPVEEIRLLVDARHVVEAYKSLGSTSPKEVKRMVEALRRRTDEHVWEIEQKEKAIESAQVLTEKIVSGILAGRHLAELL
ncbi:MAG: argininosuccinate lyase [Armatimonadetes bacterium]|nr:argininosuccinate lyase [Armatimonadota bacterium]